MHEPTFEEYVAGLGRLSAHVDPTVATPQSRAIVEAAASLTDMLTIDRAGLAGWARRHPGDVPVLGLVVGLSQEKLRNILRHTLGTSSWIRLARERPDDLVGLLDDDYGLVASLHRQLGRSYDLGDVLVARAGSRVTATRAGASGRALEDAIEQVVLGLGLTCATRTRFAGRDARTAPCDVVVPDAQRPEIVIAAKGFDSTGSKLTDAVREIEEMAAVRLPSQFVIAVVDGIGWKSRQADLRRIHHLLGARHLDGLYTVATLDAFRSDVARAARLRGLLP